MWIIEAPSSTARLASAPYSSGVYGIAGHCSRLAITPEIEQVMTTGSSRLTGSLHDSMWSYGDDPRLLPRPLDLLALRHLQPAADRGARLAWVDHVVDEVVAGGDVHVEHLFEVLDQLGLLCRRVLCRVYRLTEGDLNDPLGSHHADLGARPRNDQVGLVRAPAHHVVAGAVGLACDHRELGDGGIGDGVKHLGAVANDPFSLDLCADHEARDVLDEHQRNPERVAEVDETRGLVGRVVVEDAAELLGLVGDDPGRPATEASEAGDDRLGPLALHVEYLFIVHDVLDDLVHVIRLAVGLGQHVEQLLVAALDRIRFGPAHPHRHR